MLHVLLIPLQKLSALSLGMVLDARAQSRLNKLIVSSVMADAIRGFGLISPI